MGKTNVDPQNLPPATPYLPPGALETYGWHSFPSLLFQGDQVWVLGSTGGLLLFRNGKILDAWQKKGQGPGEFLYPSSLTLDPEGKLLICDSGKERLLFFDARNDKIHFLSERPLPASATATSELHYSQGRWLAKGFFPFHAKPHINGNMRSPLALLGPDGDVQHLLEEFPFRLPQGVPCRYPCSAYLLDEGAMLGPTIGQNDRFSLQFLGPDFKIKTTLQVPNPGLYDLPSLRKGLKTAQFFGADTPPEAIVIQILLYERWGDRLHHPFSLTHHLFDRQGKLLASWPSKRFLIRGVMGNRDNAYYTYDEDELQIYRHPLS